MELTQIATRLSCFALISAIESDLRRECRSFAEALKKTALLPTDVRDRAMVRSSDDHKGIQDQGADTDLDLLEYTDFADLAKVLYTLKAELALLNSFEVGPIARALLDLTPVRNRVCHSRPLEADDFSKLYDFAVSLIQSQSVSLFPTLGAAVALLKENPRSVLTLSIPKFWSADLATTSHNLPLPDFDDTGFQGRLKDREEIKKHLASPHPVTTIVGEGGVGKTALALRCLYDLVETPEPRRYDAIVWVSLKTKTLTSSGVTEIQDAIRSILGLAQAVAHQLGVPSTDERDLDALLDEIEEYLATFHVLLAIDNLETVSWHALRPLLVKIPSGSKVLITSRIGLGEIELRYALDPMDIHTCVALARMHARSLNLKNVIEAKQETLRVICERLYNNPLLIKWFVSSVAGGADPKSLIARQKTTFQSATEFCFENLFSNLSDLEKHICQVLAAARRSLVPAELYYLLRHIGRDEVDWAMNTLHQSSMIKRAFIKQADNMTTEYTLAEIASEYVRKQHPPSAALVEMVREQMKELREIVEAAAVQRATYKYDMFAIQASTREDKIVAAYLRRALDSSKTRDLESSRTAISQAKALAPTSSEVFRISGLIESLAGDYYEATSELEISVQLDPHCTLARYTLAQHFIRAHEMDNALDQLERTLKFDPKDRTIATAKALVLTRLGRFDKAADIYELVLPSIGGERTRKWRVSTRDQAVECYRRWAEQDKKMSDYTAGIRHLNRSLTICEEAFAKGDFDRKLLERFGEVIDGLMDSAIKGNDSDVARGVVDALLRSREVIKPVKIQLFRLRRFKSAFPTHGGVLDRTSGLTISEAETDESTYEMASDVLDESVVAQTKAIGTVSRMPAGTNYGFIRDDAGNDWFFHQGEVNDEHWQEIKPGRTVSFRLGKNSRGSCAIDVVPTYSE